MSDEDYENLINKYKNYVNSFKNKQWNLREETIKYCQNDCIVLYKVIKEFSIRIFKHLK
jgi:hypothetical protein